MNDAPGFEALHLALQVEAAYGLAASQHPACPVGAAREALLIAFADDDIALRALRSGDDTPHTGEGRCRPFAVHPHVLSEVFLFCREVVGDRHAVRLLHPALHKIVQQLQHVLHHQGAVAVAESHTIVHLTDVPLSLITVQVEICQLPLPCTFDVLFLVEGYGQAVVGVGHLLAQVAAAGMDHHPDMTVVALLDLDEMISPTQGTYLMAGALILPFHHRHLPHRDTRHIPLITGFLMMAEAQGDHRTYLLRHALQHFP